MNNAPAMPPLVRFSVVPCGDHFQHSTQIYLKQTAKDAENIETGEVANLSPETMVHHALAPVPELITITSTNETA
jgi:hypothetical protein